MLQGSVTPGLCKILQLNRRLQVEQFIRSQTHTWHHLRTQPSWRKVAPEQKVHLCPQKHVLGGLRTVCEAATSSSASSIRNSKCHPPRESKWGHAISMACEVTEWTGMPQQTSRRRLLQLQSEMAKPPSDGERLIHSQQQTFNYRINPVSLYCMTESRHHLLNVGRRWVWEQLVGFPRRLNVQDPTGSAHIHGPAAQPASINSTGSTKPS